MNPTMLNSLESSAQPDHILYGSDFPYAPGEIIPRYNELLDAFAFKSNTLDNVNRNNALNLFPR